jgi:hypothetical protein
MSINAFLVIKLLKLIKLKQFYHEEIYYFHPRGIFGLMWREQ